MKCVQNLCVSLEMHRNVAHILNKAYVIYIAISLTKIMMLYMYKHKHLDNSCNTKNLAIIKMTSMQNYYKSWILKCSTDNKLLVSMTNEKREPSFFCTVMYKPTFSLKSTVICS